MRIILFPILNARQYSIWNSIFFSDVQDLAKSAVDELEWFKVRVRVEGKRIRAWINDKQTVDYREPKNLDRKPQRAGRLLNPNGEAIALQAHDDTSTFHFREILIRPLD